LAGLDRSFASLLPAKSITALSYGLSIALIPKGILRLENILITSLSETNASMDKVNFYLKRIFLITLFISILFYIISPMLVKILYGYGAFSHVDYKLTSLASMYYSLSIPYMFLWPILYRIFQIRKSLRRIIFVAVISCILNGMLNYLFVIKLNLELIGICLGTLGAYMSLVLLNKKGVLLDIGCGDGVFLKEVQTLGFEVWGIDFDKKSVKVAKEKFKLKNVYPMSLEEFVEFANKRGLKFDVITFFEVLEHQDNPVGFMNNVKNLLKPGGYIAGTVPNRDRPLVSLDRKYVNTADFPPHHFLYFNKSSLEFLFNMFNFKDIYFSPVKVDFNHINFFIESTISMGWTKKLINLLKKNVINEENISISSYEKIYGKSWKTELLFFNKF